MKPLLYILSIFFLLTSCKEDKKDQFARLVQEWQGKEIVFPQDMAFTRFVTEQVEYRIATAEMERIDRPCRFGNKQQHPVHFRLPVER